MFDPREIPEGEYRERIDDLKAKRDAAGKKLERLEAELAWWEDGLRIFFPAREVDAFSGPDNASLLDGRKPPLREAILRVMNESQRRAWTSKDVVAVLQERGWMPTGKYAVHTVRQRLRDLANDGQITKLERGTYAKLEGAPAETSAP
jgi:1,2-phenylacetyl-CoA epoxidase catalytic subunit